MNNPLTQLSVWIALIGFTGMIVFQSLLVLGVPLGKLAWGGRFRKLPKALRIGSLAAVVIYVFGGLIILEKAGMSNLFNNSLVAETCIWLLSGIFGLSFIGNLLSQSKLEKIIMIPVSLFLCLSCTIIAWNL